MTTDQWIAIAGLVATVVFGALTLAVQVLKDVPSERRVSLAFRWGERAFRATMASLSLGMIALAALNQIGIAAILSCVAAFLFSAVFLINDPPPARKEILQLVVYIAVAVLLAVLALMARLIK